MRPLPVYQKKRFMINRVLIRLKVVQIVYAYYKNSGKSLKAAEDEVFFSLSKAYDLYNYMLLLIVGITHYAADRISFLSMKIRPTESDRNPNLKFVSIFGYDHRIRAQISKIEGFSGHGDYCEMIDYFKASQDVGLIRNTFIVHGDSSAQEAYKNHLQNAGFVGVHIPQKGECVLL